ncbi:MAG UNVERIFIED_CONTAM: peptide MFS transporter [Planctomycetaceae bacterium]|jgi:POT family proton-dependent oligopeptide transporter
MSTLTANSETPRPEPDVFGHYPGLFLLFFTEMWERFSYYGMRALLVLFLVSDAAAGGWEWSRKEAMGLYGWYTGLVYVTPIIGGMLADAFLGYRRAVLMGALLMTLGHAAMAFETRPAFYAGLVLLIIGNGLFKPNISSIVGQLYKNKPEKKDSAYTIFYMGINAGAFFGMLFCGYIGEKISWSYGFGLAGIFMFLGMLMFQFGQTIFGDLGLAPNIQNKSQKTLNESTVPKAVERDRLLVIGVLSFFTIFFWMAFEQAGDR